MEDYLCINDVFTEQQKLLFDALPVKNEAYTLKEVVKSLIDGKEGYVFYELQNPCHENGQEFSFRKSRSVKVDKAAIQQKQKTATCQLP